jgi:chorismate lyase
VVYEIIRLVRIHPYYIKLRTNWLRKPFLTLSYQRWLIGEASLTARLQKSYADFSVQPTALKLAKPMQDEATLLGLKPQQNMLLREVLLMGGNEAVVFAHSVLPRASLRGTWRGLGRLGNKPLGAALFKNPRVIRTPLSFKKLSQNHKLYQKAVEHLTVRPTYMWARRSIFSLNCANILVTEVFLPNICHE